MPALRYWSQRRGMASLGRPNRRAKRLAHPPPKVHPRQVTKNPASRPTAPSLAGGVRVARHGIEKERSAMRWRPKVVGRGCGGRDYHAGSRAPTARRLSLLPARQIWPPRPETLSNRATARFFRENLVRSRKNPYVEHIPAVIFVSPHSNLKQQITNPLSGQPRPSASLSVAPRPQSPAWSSVLIW